MDDPLRQKLAVIAAITKALEPQGIRPVVIGGLAVAFYTSGGYATDDVDLAVVGREQFGEALEALGFTREGRFWTHERFAFPIEASAGALVGKDAPLSHVDVDGWPVFILGIEDLIIDRLSAYVHWKSRADGEWVRQLLADHRAIIDQAYLRRKYEERDVTNALVELQQQERL